MSDPDSSTPSFLDLRPEYVWNRSPLKREAIDRILAAGERRRGVRAVSRDPNNEEAIRLTLAAIADMLVPFASMRRRPISTDEYHGIEAAFLKLVGLLADVREAANGPPAVPVLWAAAMSRWLIGFGLTDKSEHKSFDQRAYPLLIGVYARVFHPAAPSTARDGPTARFIESFFREMNESLQKATWNPPLRPDVEPFKMPSLDTVRNRIREHKEEAMGQQTILFLDYLYNEARTHLTNRGGANLH